MAEVKEVGGFLRRNGSQVHVNKLLGMAIEGSFADDRYESAVMRPLKTYLSSDIVYKLGSILNA